MYDLAPYQELLRCLSRAGFSNLDCLPGRGPAGQAGRRKNIEWGRRVPKAPEQQGDSRGPILRTRRLLWIHFGSFSPISTFGLDPLSEAPALAFNIGIQH